MDGKNTNRKELQLKQKKKRKKNKLDQNITFAIHPTTAIQWVCANSILLRVRESAFHAIIVVCMYCECLKLRKANP